MGICIHDIVFRNRGKVKCNTAFLVTVESGAGKIKNCAAIGISAYNGVKKQLEALHHDRNLNEVAFEQDHLTIEFLKEYPIFRKVNFEALETAVGFEGALNEHTVRASPYEILFYCFHRQAF